ncbi:MobC family plasmid mobilization relaxosome protein [[Clostridium] innocuum]|nr:MobC family plasmid mobilization relaxosome protein [[Clostridium] innocuum]MCR0560299.1 MobC family plasmid mobilization relaxosome protein [[Clostridium] innocuum]
MIEKRDQNMIIRLSSSELERIRLKMSEVEVVSLSSYIRKMALDGYCVKLDLQDVKEMVSLLRRCSNNLNQYAKRANETGSIYAEDIKDLQNRFEEIWNVAKEIMARLSTI